MTFVLIKLIQKQQVFQHCCRSSFAFGLSTKNILWKINFISISVLWSFHLGRPTLTYDYIFKDILNVYINNGYSICTSTVAIWCPARISQWPCVVLRYPFESLPDFQAPRLVLPTTVSIILFLWLIRNLCLLLEWPLSNFPREIADAHRNLYYSPPVLINSYQGVWTSLAYSEQAEPLQGCLKPTTFTIPENKSSLWGAPDS